MIRGFGLALDDDEARFKRENEEPVLQAGGLQDSS
jgi:hypothetical protein